MASGAVNPLFVHEVKKLFDKDDKIVLMCHSGKRTKLAMEVLKNAGFSDVSDIEGGIYNYSRLGAKLVEYTSSFVSKEQNGIIIPIEKCLKEN